MTAASHTVDGTRRIISSTPANTSEATLYTAAKENPVVVQLIITNLTASAANATVKWGDGSTDYDLLDRILKGYVEEDKSARELVASGLPAEAVERIIGTVDRN